MKKALLISAVFCLLLITACAPGVSDRTEERPAGFFMGIWHGWIAPITLIWQLFNRDVRIYEIYNTGWFYDFGYYMGVIAGFGGLALTRKRYR